MKSKTRSVPRLRILGATVPLYGMVCS